MSAAPNMSDVPPEHIKGFGRAVRLATPHRFNSRTTREHAVEESFLVRRRRLKAAETILWMIVLAAVVWFRGWTGAQIGTALATGLSGLKQTALLGGAILMVFLGAFAFMRLGEAALRAVLDEDDPMEWPREGVDWGRQDVVLDRDGIATSLRLVRRSYPWGSLAELHEDEVFVLDRRTGDRVVIPKDPADEDEMRDRLLRGIMLAEPLS